jgi:hypothetical protein
MSALEAVAAFHEEFAGSIDTVLELNIFEHDYRCIDQDADAMGDPHSGQLGP